MQEILVLVTDQMNCQRLIVAGSELAAQTGCSLQVLSVQPKSALKHQCGEALEYLFSIARKVQAEMTVIYHDDAAATAVRYIKRNHITRLVAGLPAEKNDSEFLRNIVMSCREVDVFLLDPWSGMEYIPATKEMPLPNCAARKEKFVASYQAV